MDLTLKNIGRRFNRDWVFKGISYKFEQGQSYAILGRNGSGKSTLLQIIAGSLSPSEGSVEYGLSNDDLNTENVYKSLSIAAPYLELIEEFTLVEMIDFHFKFKGFHKGLDSAQLLQILDLQTSKNKEIKYFSSGMKQRTKLALAVCCNTPLLLLDEPASNLDSQAIDWYQNLLQTYSADRTVIICSNQEYEYSVCKHHLDITTYK